MKFVFFIFLTFGFSAHAFVERRVSFSVGNGIKLNAYLTSPNVEATYPVLILQMGHGKGTTDSDKRDYNPFAKLARDIAESGFLVLRFDKRGTGYNELNGSFADGTFFDYVNDLRAAVEFMRKQSLARADEIYLFGHSLGGPVVSFVAKDVDAVKGIILSASPGRPYADFNLEQMKFLFELGHGMSKKDLQAALDGVDRENELISSPQRFCQEFSQHCEIKNGSYYIYGQSTEFWKEIDDLDPLAPLKELNCKVFSIHGSSDWVISSDNDAGAIQRALKKNPNYSKLILPKLDHFLAETPSKKHSVELFTKGLPEGDVKIHPDFIPEIRKVLFAWVTESPKI